MEVSGEEGQLVTAIHDEGGGLILCEGQAQDYDCTLSSHGCFGLAGADITVTFKVRLCALTVQFV
jgi:hypothetical protein